MSNFQAFGDNLNTNPSDYAQFLQRCKEKRLKPLQEAFLAGEELVPRLDHKLLKTVSNPQNDGGTLRYPGRLEINASLTTGVCWSLAAPDILQVGTPKLLPAPTASAPQAANVLDATLTANEPFNNVVQGECRSLDASIRNWRGSAEYQQKIKAALSMPPEELTCNKGGVVITGHVDFGLKRVGLQNETASKIYERPAPPAPKYYRTLNIVNGSLKPVVLIDVCSIPSIVETFTLYDDHGVAHQHDGKEHSGYDLSTGVLLQRGAHYQVTVELRCGYQDIAWHQQWLLFMFVNETNAFRSKNIFVIGRRVSALVAQIIEDVKSCLSTEARPFYPASLRGLFDRVPHSYDMATSCMFGARGKRMQMPAYCQTHLLSVWPVHSLDFEEALIAGALKSNPEGGRSCACRSRQLRQLSRLLALEETAMERDIKDYDLFNVKLHRLKANTFDLEVPGLPENRPSVMSQDILYIRMATNSQVECTADVVAVDYQPMPRLILELPVSFTSKYPDLAVHIVHVRFTFDRLALTRMHKALAMVARSTIKLLPCICKGEAITTEISSPAEENATSTLERPALPNKMSNSQMVLLPDNLYESKEKISSTGKINEALNFEQWESVKSITNRSHGSGPYVILGPPGTGKTMTVVECVLQLVLRNPDVRLLVCAPSNYAADILCSGIAAGGVGPSQMWRMNDPRRAVAAIKVDVLPFCKLKPLKGGPKLPYKVIVCTCGASGMLNENLPLGKQEHLTHIFIDEAGQALIPEAFIPFSLGTTETSCILCGDPKQLGPVVHSKYAVENGFDESLIGRFQDVAAAKGGNGNKVDGWVVFKLIRNYRANIKLLELPSKLFYNDELIAAAPASMTAPPRDWNEMKGRDFPLLFFGVKGQQMREGESPSYFNPVEAGKLLDLITGLIAKTQISAADIGVMAPYRRQVQKLRMLLRSRGLGSIRVGTVDDYQGQEERVVFISTVLTRPESLKLAKSSGRNGQIGFLSNAKRFNVAITRAKAMLVVVGHPLLLASDEYWSELLRHCLARDAFRGYGSQFVIPSHDPDMPSDLENLSMADEDEEGDENTRNERAFEEMGKAISKIAEHALLGKGDTFKLYPVGLDSYYTAMSEETEWRVQL